MRVVRICKRKYIRLDGKGAGISGGRWNSPGHPMVYTGSCGALAALEYLAHAADPPKTLVRLVIEIPETLAVEYSEWVPADVVTSRQMGDEWLASKATPVLKVPSVLVPGQFNFLINPKHRLAKAISISIRSPFAFDPRLISFPPL